jgi:hypothetical protein
MLASPEPYRSDLWIGATWLLLKKLLMFEELLLEE